MEGIIFIAHGGPGSGRYPKGSGKNPRAAYKKVKKIAKKDYKLNYEDKHKDLNNYIDKKQHRTLTKSGSDFRKAVNTVYDSDGYVRKDATANDSKKMYTAGRVHQRNADKIAREILGKYGNVKISVATYGQPATGKKMKKGKYQTTAKEYLSTNLRFYYD